MDSVQEIYVTNYEFMLAYLSTCLRMFHMLEFSCGKLIICATYRAKFWTTKVERMKELVHLA